MTSSPSSRDDCWTATRPNRWERDTDEVEHFYTSLARCYEGTGRVFFAITAHVSFAVDFCKSMEETSQRVISAMRLAWLRIRHDHPTIASWVEYQSNNERCRKVYETSFTQEVVVREWLDETFRPVSTSQTGEEWCNSDPPAPKRPTLFLIYNKDHSPENRKVFDIVIRAHHDVIDGVGSLLLLDNLMHHASAAFQNPEGFHIPKFGTEYENLSPPFRIAASLTGHLTTEQALKLQQAKKQKETCLQGIDIATVPYDDTKTVPGVHKRMHLKLSLEETKRLLAACKKIGASVTQVYHASAAMVLFSLQKKHTTERKVRYVNYCLINERGKCQEPYNSSLHPVTAYHSVSGKSLVIDSIIPAVGEPGPTDKEQRIQFLEVVENIKNYYVKIRDDREHVHLVPSYWALATPPYVSSDETPPIPSPNPAPSVSISSMGVIDKMIKQRHGDFEISSPWVTGEELGNGFGLFLGTFRGCLELSIAYNDAWHTREETRGFIEKCNALVRDSLEVF